MRGSARGPMIVMLVVAACAIAPVFCDAQERAVEARNRALLDRKLGLFTAPLAARLDPRARQVLGRIRSAGRWLLALRYYHVRSADLDSLWTWSRDQAAAYRRTDEFTAMVAAIENVRDTFALLNPGFAIRVEIGQRSLARQIVNWNSVRSVGAAADSLVAYCRMLMEDTLLSETPDAMAQRLFDSLFLGAPDPIEPTVALPGFSQHGQLRAFDFKIVTKGGRLIAGASSRAIAPIWEARGWTARLREAVDRACPGCFVGPLQKPYEPWHYTWIGPASDSTGP